MKKKIVQSTAADVLNNPYTFKKPKIRGPYTNIYLIRHCHPAYELQEKLGDLKMPLSSIGLEQRGFLTKKLLTKNLILVPKNIIK